MESHKTKGARSKRKVALVTGGARRLGRHIALGLAREEYDVVITYRNSAKDAQRTLSELKALGSKAIALRAEVSKRADVNRILAQVEKKYARLDVLVGNAGVFPPATPFDEITEKLFDDTISSNLKGNFLFAQAASRLMKRNARGGSIVIMASLGAFQIWKDTLSYNVSKAGVVALTRAMARALAPQGISVNAIAPGYIEMQDEPGAMSGSSVDRVPMKRNGTPEDIVRAVLFFTQSASYITGEILKVDGGKHLLAV